MHQTMLRAGVMAVGLAFAGVSQAAVYSFVAGSTSYTLNVGETVSVPIFFQETLAESEPSIFDSEDGLTAVGVKTQFVSTTATTPTRILSVADVALNFVLFADTPFSVYSVAGGDADILAQSVDFPGPVPSGGPRRVLIANLTFTAGSDDNGGVTIVNLLDRDTTPSAVETTTGFGTSVEPTFSTSITFNVIPEPAGFLAAVGLIPLLRRRRQG